MPLDADELRAWRDYVGDLVDVAEAQVTAELGRDVGTDAQEVRLHNWLIGHLRSRVIDLTAQHRWLTDAEAVVFAGGTHPAQYLTPPVFGTNVSRPAKPPPWTAG